MYELPILMSSIIGSIRNTLGEFIGSITYLLCVASNIVSLMTLVLDVWAYGVAGMVDFTNINN